MVVGVREAELDIRRCFSVQLPFLPCGVRVKPRPMTKEGLTRKLLVG
jgi:hypothetical protein